MKPVLWLLFLGVLLLAHREVQAQDLSYSSVDRATVRVLAIGPPDIVDIEHRQATYHIGIPVGGHGSGTMLTTDGLILTAAHVVENARALSVHLPGVREPLPAQVVYANDEEDYAFVRVLGTFAHAAQLAPAATPLRIRETVFAIGYPLDATRADPQSSRGAISGRLPDGRLQLDISVNPGNSGGPVIDEHEQIQAMIVARSDVSQGAVGLAAAVPASVFRAKFEALAAKRPRLSHLQSDSARKLSSMVSMMTSEGPELFKGSLENSSAQERTNQRVKRLAKDMRESADAQMLAAVYFWNRYMVRIANGKDGQRLQERAKSYANRAVKLEPTLVDESPFIRHVTAEDTSPPRPEGGKSRARYHERFFFRLGSGVQYLSWAPVSDEDVTLRGATLPFEVMIGGGPGGLVFGGMLSVAQTSNASPSSPAFVGDVEGNVSLVRLDGFFQWYPNPKEGFYVQGRLGAFGLSAEYVVTEASWNEYRASRTHSGYTCTIGAGYDIWIADQWGVNLGLAAAYLTESSHRGGSGWNPAFSLGFTYH